MPSLEPIVKPINPDKAMSQEDFNKITDSVIDKTLFCTKEVLTAEETARYMGISKSYLYKLTMRGEIPHYKPMGKMCYFNRRELEQWLLQNRCSTSIEIGDRANRIIMRQEVKSNAAAFCAAKGGSI